MDERKKRGRGCSLNERKEERERVYLGLRERREKEGVAWIKGKKRERERSLNKGGRGRSFDEGRELGRACDLDEQNEGEEKTKL